MKVKNDNNSQDIGQLLFQRTKDCVLLIDENGLIQYTNSNVNPLFGYNRQVLLDKKIALLFPIKYYSVINTYLYRCINNVNFDISENFQNLFGQTKSGANFPVEITLQQYNYQGNKMVLLKIIDKTDTYKISNKELELAKSLLEEKKDKRIQTQFVSKTSHELRTPLTTILNSVGILDKLKGSFGYENIQTKNIERIKNAVDQLTLVLNDFLTLNMIKENDYLAKTKIKIIPFIEEIVEKLNNSTRKQSYINYKHKGNLTININKVMLQSIINNLLSNAIKYSPNAKPIKFKTKIKNGVLTIFCNDQGIGIPKKDQKKLFKRYYRANNAIDIQGTGLGLSIIKEYLDNINGTIKVKSKEGKTTFVVKIPVCN